MGPAYPPKRHQEFLEEQGCLDESPLSEEEFNSNEHSEDVIALIEENARLRGLVVKLTGLILKSVTDRG